MKRAFSVLSLLAVFGGTWGLQDYLMSPHKVDPPVIVEVAPNPQGPVLFNKDGLPTEMLPNMWRMANGAQVCPVSPTLALTARHTAVLTPASWGYPGSFYGGTLVLEWVDTRRDLGAMRIGRGPAFRRWYEVAKTPPGIGDKVFIQGYNRGKDFTSFWMETTLVYAYAGTLAWGKSPGKGSSGSCVLNKRGEVVAINTASYETDKGETHGSGVLIFGPWVPDSMWQTKDKVGDE